MASDIRPVAAMDLLIMQQWPLVVRGPQDENPWLKVFLVLSSLLVQLFHWRNRRAKIWTSKLALIYLPAHCLFVCLLVCLCDYFSVLLFLRSLRHKILPKRKLTLSLPVTFRIINMLTPFIGNKIRRHNIYVDIMLPVCAYNAELNIHFYLSVVLY